MSFLKRIILTGIVVVLASCAESEIIFPEGYEDGGNGNGNEQTEVYFTFTSYESTLFSENWIIIHTDDGVLLDYRRYEKGEELIFEEESSLVPDKIAITLYRYQNFLGNGGNNNLDFNTTLGVDKGSVWDNPPLESEGSNQVGFFDLTLNNFPEIIGLFISNENHLVNGFSNFTSTGVAPSITYTPPSMPLYEEDEYCITFLEDNQDFKYHFLVNVQDGDNLSVNYDEFQFFDSYLSVDLPIDYFYDLSIKGLEDYQDIDGLGGFTLERALYHADGYMSDFLNHNPLKIGYLDRFNIYKTSLDVTKGKYAYEYRKTGDKPTEINVIDEPNISINSDFVQNFEFDVDVSYTDYEVSWQSVTGTYNVDQVRLNWRIEVPFGSDHVVGDIPEEVLELYPWINIGFSGLRLNDIGLTVSPEEKLRFYFGD